MKATNRIAITGKAAESWDRIFGGEKPSPEVACPGEWLGPCGPCSRGEMVDAYGVSMHACDRCPPYVVTDHCPCCGVMVP